MKKSHGCLWYIFIFPIVAPVYFCIYFIKFIIKICSKLSNASTRPIYYSSGITGYDYEYICANYLRNQRFVNVNVTKGSGDQGADIIAWKDGRKYAIQCKYYQNPVGNKAVQEAFSAKAYYGCDCAMVMTNNSFTKSAKELAQSTGVYLMPYIHCNMHQQQHQQYSPTPPQFYPVNNYNQSQNNFVQAKQSTKKNKFNDYELEQFARECNAYVEKEERKNRW